MYPRLRGERSHMMAPGGATVGSNRGLSFRLKPRPPFTTTSTTITTTTANTANTATSITIPFGPSTASRAAAARYSARAQSRPRQSPFLNGLPSQSIGMASSSVSSPSPSAAAAAAGAAEVEAEPRPAMTAKTMMEPAGPGFDPHRCDALIVGGGPAGLATALLLARRGGWDRIVVLEKRPSLDQEEADKSYVYMIDGRGFALTDAAGVTSAVTAAGVGVTSELSIVTVAPDGSFTERTFGMKDATRPNVWLPRRAFLTALYSGLAEAERDGRVRLLYNTHVTDIRLAHHASDDATTASGAAPVVVHARAADGVELRFTPRLLVGADGLYSEVRQALTGWAPSAGLPADHFTPVILDSPSAGLRYKVLTLPPNPPFRRKAAAAAAATKPPPPPGAEGSPAPSASAASAAVDSGDDVIPNSKFAIIPGRPAPRGRAMRLGLLPLRNPTGNRTANIIAPQDHAVWALGSGAELGAFLQDTFPQLDIPFLFSPQQLDTIAASRGGVFPKPQYLRHLTAVLPPAPAPTPDPATAATATRAEQPTTSTTTTTTTTTTSSSSSSRPSPSGSSSSSSSPPPSSSSTRSGSGCCGVVLVGDAVHCFPPDLGQGVNSAMTDVMELAQALDEAGGNLAAALPLYESRRAPEAAALAEIMTFGAPYQYNQDALQRTLWGLNVALRAALHKLLPAAFAPQTFVLVQQAEISYAQMLDRVHATTRRIWALAGLLAAALGAMAVKTAMAAAAAAASGAPVPV